MLARELWWNPEHNPMNESAFYPLVRVIKLSEAEHPVVRAGSWTTYLPGASNVESLPIDYEIIGFLLTPVKVGGCLHILRIARNGVVRPGRFSSTSIRRLDTEPTRQGVMRVVTTNSVYLLTPFE